MLHPDGNLGKPPCKQKRNGPAICAAVKQACALTCTVAPTMAQKRYKRRVNTGVEDLPQQLPQILYQQRQQQVQQQQQGPNEQQMQRHRRYAIKRKPRDINKLLTSMIMSATSWHDLQAVHQLHKHRFGPLHTAAMLSKLAKVVNSPKKPTGWQQQQQQQQRITPVQSTEVQDFVGSELLPQLVSHAAELGPRGLANCVWALNKLQILLEPQQQVLLQQQLAAAVPEMQPQHISSVLYALAQQEVAADEQAHATTAAAPAAAAAAAASMHSSINHSGGSLVPQPIRLQQQQHVQLPLQSTSIEAADSGQQPQDGLVGALLAAAAHRLPEFGPQALSNTLYAAARLQHSPEDAWLVQYWDVSARCMAAAEQQHLSNMLWAAAVLRLSPPGSWRDAWMRHSSSSLAEAVPQGLSNSLWAAAKLGWAGAVLTPGNEGDASSSSSSSWLGRFCTVSIGQLSLFADQALSNCCWAMGSIAQQLKQQEQQQQQVQNGLQAVSAAVMQQLLQQTGWQRQLLKQLQPRLLGFSPQQLSNTLWGFASSGLAVPSAWLETFVRASGPKLTQFSPQELSGVLVALARLHFNPGPSWMNLFELSVQRGLKTCDSQVVSNVVWAMRHLQHQPSEGWLQALLLEVHSRLAVMSAAPALAGHGATTSSSRYLFTSKGLSVTLLCLSQFLASSGSTQLPATTRLWSLLQLQLLDASDPACLLSGITSQGLCYLAGAAALSNQQQLGQQLVLANLRQLVHQQQQQKQRHHQHTRPKLFGEVQDHQQQHQQWLSSSSRVHCTSSPVADVSMVLWAAARLEMQPPLDLVMPLLNQVLQSLQDPTFHNRAEMSRHRRGAKSSTKGSTSSVEQGDEDCNKNSDIVDASTGVPSSGPDSKRLGALMYALGFMGCDPGSLWFRSWFRVTRPLLKQCNCWTLAMLFWGAVYLQEVPPSHWLRDWAVAWGMQQLKVSVSLTAGHDPIQGQQQQWQQHKRQNVQHADSVAAEVAAAAGRQGLRVAKKAAVAKELGGLRDVQDLHRLCLSLVRQDPGQP